MRLRILGFVAAATLALATRGWAQEAAPPRDTDISHRVRHLPAPLYLRRSFEPERRPVRARLYASARALR